MANAKIVIESRVQLFSTLAEAAEIEHNFMCLYLYAVMGLKRHVHEGVTVEELAVIEKWRRSILGVSLEEMTHLALVSNLFVAIGSTPHFSRPNFPAVPGLYPEGIVVELAKFDLDTLDHFIYLERPRSEELSDGLSFSSDIHYTRTAPFGRLMAYHGDYETVGDLYQSVRESITYLCNKIGEQELFCGDPAQQIGPLDAPLPGLIVIKDRETAFKAIDTIITQGEGALEVKDSHFARFLEIKREYLEMLQKNPAFDPSRPIARNPVMRKPLDGRNRVYVDEPLASQLMDLSNALYMYMLKTLVQVYTVEGRAASEKKTILDISFAAMHVMATVGEALTYLAASAESPGIKAGMNFAVNRFMSSLSTRGEVVISIERLLQIDTKLLALICEIEKRKSENSEFSICCEKLKLAQETLSGILRHAQDFVNQITSKVTSTSSASSLAAVAKSSQSVEIEVADSEAISVSFETKKCMHARHCVTQLPGVFLANTPGKWILPEKSYPEELAAIIRQCPSGALLYKSKTAALHDEEAPAVNVLRIRENGPYTFLGELEIDGKKDGFRATLCRCGNSANKPYCDSAHVRENFKSTGEPATVDATELKARGGAICINRTQDGPLDLTGNLEICTGSGRVVLRTEKVKLCRCGQSKLKPICDSSHIAANFKDAVKQHVMEQDLHLSSP